MSGGLVHYMVQLFVCCAYVLTSQTPRLVQTWDYLCFTIEFACGMFLALDCQAIASRSLQLDHGSNRPFCRIRTWLQCTHNHKSHHSVMYSVIQSDTEDSSLSHHSSVVSCLSPSFCHPLSLVLTLSPSVSPTESRCLSHYLETPTDSR